MWVNGEERLNKLYDDGDLIIEKDGKGRMSLYRKQRPEGIFIATSFNSGFIKEVARLKRNEDIKIFYFTIKDIFEKKHKKLTNQIFLRKFQVG